MVSTNRNKNCKILSCLGEIVFFYSEFFASGNHGGQFLKKKLLCSQQKLFFWLVKNSFFCLSDIPDCENSFSVKWKRFFNKFFVRLVETNFLSSGKSIFLFRALLKLLKFGGWQFLLVKTDFLTSRTYFFQFLRYSFQ